jgi:hypothetical protein
VLINQGEPAERVRAWLAGRRLDLQHVLLDPRGGATAALDAAGLPTTLFYAADGRLVSRRVGEVSEATLSAELERIKK